MSYLVEKNQNNLPCNNLAEAHPHSRSSSPAPSNKFDRLMKDKSCSNKKGERTVKKTEATEGTYSIFDLAKEGRAQEYVIEIAVESFIEGPSNAIITELTLQLIDRIDVMNKTDQTETSFTLQFPPVFEGTQVTIVEYSAAPREYNVYFTNLEVVSIDGRHLLEKKVAELRQQLDAKGIVVQQVQTDLKEYKSFASHTSQQQHSKDSKQQQQDSQKEQKEQKEKQSKQQEATALV